MASSPLHITNGDSFTKKLNSLNLKGEIITWREMLCEGKTLTSVGSESFWKARYDFLHKNYRVSKSSFIEKTLKEYRTLCNHKQQDQIVLWFDNHLFCQINMLAVISWLKTNRKYAQISLVFNDKKDESNTLTALSKEELLDGYKNRTILTQDDIEYADYVWQLYCSDNPMHLENLNDFKKYKFDHLSDAITNHLQRFPSIKNGLNAMENKILQSAALSKETINSKKELIKTLLQNQTGLGFGDVQYNRAITRLKPLFTSLSPIQISKKGKAILNNTTNLYGELQNNTIYLGGAPKYGFIYNNNTDRILKL